MVWGAGYGWKRVTLVMHVVCNHSFGILNERCTEPTLPLSNTLTVLEIRSNLIKITAIGMKLELRFGWLEFIEGHDIMWNDVYKKLSINQITPMFTTASKDTCTLYLFAFRRPTGYCFVKNFKTNILFIVFTYLVTANRNRRTGLIISPFNLILISLMLSLFLWFETRRKR